MNLTQHNFRFKVSRRILSRSAWPINEEKYRIDEGEGTDLMQN